MHIKRVELSHFKSFGGTTQVPLMPGFTVISGPNGSGKSNILDALLFALGLASSKGMRADRLPDLVNQNQANRRSTSEASVTVTFDISDVPPELLQGEAFDNSITAAVAGSQVGAEGTVAVADKVVPLAATPQEWTVTRRLRVTPQGTYTSNYFINGEACTLNELHDQLQRFRIYPEGYNVVLQGDVTSIISMNPRERREIIDELAGVASFDRKINQAREKLEVVKDREERFRIVERELQGQLERLAQDRQKAERYQKLKAQFQEKSQWERVLVWRSQQTKLQALLQQIEEGEREAAQLVQTIAESSGALTTLGAELETLNARVKALGEDEHLALQAKLATQEAELRQLQRQEQELKQASYGTTEGLRQAQIAIQNHQRDLEALAQEIADLETGELIQLAQARDAVQRELNERREAASAIASASEAWVQEQTQLRHQVEALLTSLEPQRAEQVRLQERFSQLEQQIQSHTDTLQALTAEANSQEEQAQTLATRELAAAEKTVQILAQQLTELEQELNVQRETQTRLLREQRDSQRQLDKLEAQVQALQESQGTQSTKVLLDSGLKGICGLIAQLGKVEPRYQMALEIAAGGRLGYLVVENDSIAARGIELLKQRRAGRATFLPLNAIRAPKFTPISAWQRPDGFIDYAVNLIDCEPRYQEVFTYVFGNTVVFETLEEARRHLGQFRIVTLDGEMLETSGAMTGGSLLRRQGGLHFGTVEPAESDEAKALRNRLQEIEMILARCERTIEQATSTLRQTSQALVEARQRHRELELQVKQNQTQHQQLHERQSQSQSQLDRCQQELTAVQARLQALAATLPAQESAIQAKRQALAELEQSQSHGEWQQAQAQIRGLEGQLSERQQTLQVAERHLQERQTQRERLESAIQQNQQRLDTLRQQQRQQQTQLEALEAQQTELAAAADQSRQAIAVLDQTLATEKANRDRIEYQLRERQNAKQQQEWQRQKLLEVQQERRQQQTVLQAQLEAQAAELPDPLPEIPVELDLETLEKELRSLQRRLEALEPVNMLALEEYNRTQERLEDLSQKLGTLEEERTELLLRVENFTTLRRQAFQEAFNAVNKNFEAIFAELSDGDGHLQLDDSQDPFNGGLNLVAHPKGKPVRRLASMSGGEKSLTALSFIFALQRYRPSPFYAFDEVDMFLDGANVERLSRMIKHQAKQAQFIVVSLRRPMIESSQRTIGVTQARGAYTQVLGIDLQSKSAATV
ncbi:chromosome segregation protein SMC [Pseudanabaena sp. FACHB-2040]|uniref:chromosome segregation protein SMC n=1 Tax=Pseudanabaena sp. FACHB-2040 TaxID=2692859 RepID=UPI001682DE07|nr:chromosome segregation protein SMC [Pseudanabaena sp. FACHB-2040]